MSFVYIFQKYKSNASVDDAITLISEKTTIKTEQGDDETNFIELNTIQNDIGDAPSEASTSLLSEKKIIIDKLRVATTENKKLYFDSRKQSELINTLKATAVERELHFNREVSSLERQIEEAKLSASRQDETINAMREKAAQKELGLKQQLLSVSNELAKTKSALEAQKLSLSQVQNLKRQNKSLSARIAQLQIERPPCHCIRSQHATSSKSPKAFSILNEKSKVYEVEQILADKMVKKTRHFLIRWKGYDSSYDTWEKQSNLNCRQILSAYLKSL